MNGAEALASLGIAGVVICVFIAVAEIYKRHISYKERRLELEGVQTSAQLKQLEERMRVLERIATDKGIDVAAQIDGLRDAPLATPDKELSR